MRWMIRTALLCLMCVAVLAPVAAQDDAPDPIRVGSKDFSENIMLGQMIVIALQDLGLPAEDFTNIGNTLETRGAFDARQIDAYPEYTGTAYANLFGNVAWFEISPEIASSAYATYAEVASTDAIVNDVIWLVPAPANNTFAIAVRREFSEANNLRTMSDFAAFVNGGGEILLASSDVFAQRPDGLPAFQQMYGFELAGAQLLVIGTTDAGIFEQAVRDGVNGINAGLAFGTDGTIPAYDLVILEDDQGALPVFQPTPIFHGDIIRQYPEIAGQLNPIFASLDDETLRMLNAEVQVVGRPSMEVAQEYLDANGFIGEASATATEEP